MKYLEKNSKVLLIAIFIIGVIVYGLLASKMTSPTYLNVDEELYVSMARTFFFDGNIAKNYETLNYNCVVYSIIISIAYFFGNAGNILFLMRLIGVILMISSVFPIYLLSKEILNSKWKAIVVAAVSLLIPEFVLTFYLVQEVLCYPIFLWICLFIYLKFKKEKSTAIDVLLIVLLALIFFVKSYAIVFAAAYFATLCLIELKNKDYKKLGKAVLQGVICLALILIRNFLNTCIKWRRSKPLLSANVRNISNNIRKSDCTFLWDFLLCCVFPILYRIFTNTYTALQI